MIKANIVAHSLSPQGDELISVLCTFPRIILAEVNTHRMLCKNTSSSRAIPLKKMVEVVQNNPFIPIAWQQHHPGMQGTTYLSKTDKFNLNSFVSTCIDTLNTKNKDSKEYLIEKKRVEEKIELITGLLKNYVNETKTLDEWWLFARDKAVEAASILYVFDVTKQLCNRLLEPFVWTTMLITGSREGWDNFFHLRCPAYYFNEDGPYKSKYEIWDKYPDSNMDYATDIEWLYCNEGQAEIHMMALAESIYDAVNKSTPKQLQAGEWHIPFVDNLNQHEIAQIISSSHPPYNEIKVKISTAMSARTSYTVVGDEKEIDYERLINLHNLLIEQDPPHSSPLEHCARVMNNEEYVCFAKGLLNAVEIDEPNKGEYVAYLKMWSDDSEAGWCGPYKGFMSYRYFIDNKLNAF